MSGLPLSASRRRLTIARCPRISSALPSRRSRSGSASCPETHRLPRRVAEVAPSCLFSFSLHDELLGSAPDARVGLSRRSLSTYEPVPPGTAISTRPSDCDTPDPYDPSRSESARAARSFRLLTPGDPPAVLLKDVCFMRATCSNVWESGHRASGRPEAESLESCACRDKLVSDTPS